MEHGQWLPWLEEHFEASQRSAHGYMRLYAKRELLANSQRVADLTIRGGLALLKSAHVANSSGENGIRHGGRLDNSALRGTMQPATENAPVKFPASEDGTAHTGWSIYRYFLERTER